MIPGVNNDDLKETDQIWLIYHMFVRCYICEHKAGNLSERVIQLKCKKEELYKQQTFLGHLM